MLNNEGAFTIIPPATAVIELTYRCNHRCLFCSCPWEAERSFEKLQEMSTEQWKDALRDLCDLGSQLASRREALLREDCLELIELLRVSRR